MSVSVVSPEFIGRREELESLTALLDRAQRGSPAFALIGGEAGVGKTRLLAELTGRAAGAGFLVLTGQCVELGAEGPPLAPLVDALRALARDVEPGLLAAALGPARSGLARLLPGLAEDGEAKVAGEDIGKAQLLELVLGMFGRLSTARPVLFGVEDLHWADQSTLDLTAFLIRSLRAARVLMVATYRSDELHRGHRLRPLLAGWERTRSVSRVNVRRFGRAEVAAQLAAILDAEPAPGVVGGVFDRSEGNAYLVEELAGVVRADGNLAGLPPSLRDVLLSRVDTLSADARRLLHTASVAGRTVTDGLLSEVAGLGEAELFAALREAVENHLLLIDPSGYGYSFRHALTRDAVYEDMLPGERVRLHAAYGAALAGDRHPAGVTGLVPDEAGLLTALAHHWYAALDLPRALPAAVDAARHALACYAPAEALRHLDRAMEIWPRVDDATRRTGLDQAGLIGLAADAAYRSGAVDRSESLLASALAELPATASPERRALLLEQSAQAQRDGGRAGAAGASLEQALALLSPDGNTRAHAVVLAALARSLSHDSQMDQAAEMAMRALPAARAVAAKDVEADAAITLGLASSYLEPSGESLDLLRAGVRMALDLDIAATALRGYINLSDVLELFGRHAEAAQAAVEGSDLAARAGLTRAFGAYLTGNQAESLLRMGHWAEVDRLTGQALQALPEGLFEATLRQMRAELAAMRGDYSAAARELDAGRRAAGDSADIQFTHSMRYIAALIALGEGDLAAARQAVAAALPDEPVPWTARYLWPLLWLGMRAEADEATRYRDRREEVGAEVLRRATALAGTAARLSTMSPSARGYRALAAAEHARSSGTAGPADWVAAVTAWEEADEPYPLAYSLLRLAEICCEAGGRPQAALAIQRAHAVAGRVGAAHITREAAALARRARLALEPGAEPAEQHDELSRFGLTEREREILQLLAAGQSNPEIARTLFISPKTVSVHVSNIMAKLGVSGRVEAAAVAHRLGTGPA